MSEVSWVRTVYLYLFALVGLAITVIGAVMLVNLALKTWIFTKADTGYNYVERPPALVVEKDEALVVALADCDEGCDLTEQQQEQIKMWLEDYEWWQNNQKDQQVDYTARTRQRQASTAISMIIVGLPLYLYHWAVIKRDRKKKKEQQKEVV